MAYESVTCIKKNAVLHTSEFTLHSLLNMKTIAFSYEFIFVLTLYITGVICQKNVVKGEAFRKNT